MSNKHWTFVFNVILENPGLREFPLNGRNFTWANNLPEPTYEKLYRVLCCPVWEEKHPLTIVQSLAREVSDHTPLIVDTGEHSKNEPIFRYKNCSNMRKSFREVVYKFWRAPFRGDVMERWQFRLRELRKKTKGWKRNVDACYRNIKIKIITKLDGIDMMAERQGLTACDILE